MKHPVADRQTVQRVLGWLGNAPLCPMQWDQLDYLAEWLEVEAVIAGGLGPHEADRIWSRHIADSLTFARGWTGNRPPSRLIDVGSGVGLPGIPLAILWPETRVLLLDRSGKRVDLARRAVRGLGLDNVEVRQGDALSERPKWEGAVFRAAFPPERGLEIGELILRPTGTAVIGLRGNDTKRAFDDASSSGRTVQVVEIPSTVLDGTASLLIMGIREH